MGKVVKLETPGEQRAPAARRRRGSRPGSKTALVLGGGGFTGAVYHIGALRALDLLAVNRTVNQFDVYVGTSAGAFVSASVANGITPEEMMRALNPRLPSAISDLSLSKLLRPNVRGLATRAALLPLRMAGLARDLAGRLGDVTMMDLGLGLFDTLPTGLYSGSGLESYVEEVLSDPDRTNDFRMLSRELYLTATDLDTTERIVFGDGDWMDVPISTAVAASTALPLVYRPVELRGRQLIDGGIRSTTNVDIAVERGAKFIVVVNPLVPYENDFRKQIPTIFGTRVRRVSDMGAAAILNQAFRILSHDRLHRAVEDWSQKYPGVDILLIEPEPDDELMFGTSIMDYASRLRIARHGFESVTLKLARDYDRYAEMTERHGIEISPQRVSSVMEHVEREQAEIPAWRRVFEQTTATLLRQAGRDQPPRAVPDADEPAESA